MQTIPVSLQASCLGKQACVQGIQTDLTKPVLQDAINLVAEQGNNLPRLAQQAD
ncbi:hypothetical protein [Undibacterium sp. TJN19]|uniref:hypothetical protein n=1 Tax=Undibacterium sp. TJN19 TaxID=3413055 RepID=UPI003BF5AA5C